jgi:hypothetical protein
VRFCLGGGTKAAILRNSFGRKQKVRGAIRQWPLHAVRQAAVFTFGQPL